MTPAKLADLPRANVKKYAFQPLPPPSEFQIADQLSAAMPKGLRLLSDNALLHAALVDRGIDVVPVVAKNAECAPGYRVFRLFG